MAAPPARGCTLDGGVIELRGNNRPASAGMERLTLSWAQLPLRLPRHCGDGPSEAGGALPVT